MATSIALHPPAFMDGIAVAAQDLRLQATSAFLVGASPSGTTGIAARPGVRYGIGSPLLVSPSSGMTISVSAGTAFVQGSASATAGMYVGCLDTAGTLTLATSDPTNPRIDNIIMVFVDNGNNTSTGTVTFQTGTPAPSPTAPTLPANSLLLAQIAVAALATTITSGNITDSRVYTAALGGILPMANTSGGITGPAGQYAHDLSSGRMRVSDGSGNARQPKTGAFAAVYNQINNNNVATSISAWTTIVSVSVTTDGSTELELFSSWTAIIPASGVSTGDFIEFVFVIDGSTSGIAGQGAPYIVRVDSTNANNADFGNLRNWATPSAGTHTIGLLTKCQGSAFGVSYPFIRVAPSLQQ